MRNPHPNQGEHTKTTGCRFDPNYTSDPPPRQGAHPRQPRAKAKSHPSSGANTGEIDTASVPQHLPPDSFEDAAVDRGNPDPLSRTRFDFLSS